MIYEYLNMMYNISLQNLTSIVVIFTRLFDTMFNIQKKISESNNHLIEIICQDIVTNNLENDLSKEEIINICEYKFYENKNIWNIIDNSLLKMLIKKNLKIH